MFCRMCGSQLGEGEKFCSNCGAPVGETTAAPAVPEVPVAPVTPPAPVAPAAVAPVAGNPLLSARTSPLYLAAVICLSVAAVFQLINVFTTMSALVSYGNYYVSDASVKSAMIGFTLSALAGLTITAILLIGLWMVYASGVGQGKDANLTRGLKLVRGGVLAQMIYMIVILALVVLVALVMILMAQDIAASYYDYYNYREASGAVAAVGVVMLLLAAGMGALMIVFYLKARTALGHALAAAQTGTATGAPSMFVIVMCFVIAGLTVLLLLANGSAGGGIAVISNLASIAANILFGIVALQYRNQVLAS